MDFQYGSTFLGRPCDETGDQLLQLFAAARGTRCLAAFVLFQSDGDERFFPALKAFIVVHRHMIPLTGDLLTLFERGRFDPSQLWPSQSAV